MDGRRVDHAWAAACWRVSIVRTMTQARHRILVKPVLHIIGPSALIMTPFLGLAFHSDQRIMMYWLTGQFSANPVAIIRQTFLETSEFLQKGNFRPVGRFIVYMEQSSIFQLASGTGMAPYVVQGLLRLVMITLLALAATHFVLALYKSAVYPSVAHDDLARSQALSRPTPASLSAFPLVLASMMVVSGSLHPISFFPVFFIAIAIALLLIPLYICSDRSMAERGIGKRDAVLCAFLGLISPMTSELLYLLPLVCFLTIVARGVLARFSAVDMIRCSASSRLASLLFGFIVVFVPSRLAIAVPSRLAIAIECSRNDCYEGSEIVLSDLSMQQWLGRTIAGLQWDTLPSMLRGEYGRGSPVSNITDSTNSLWLILAIVLLGYFAVGAGVRFARSQGPDQDVTDIAQRRLGIVLVGMGSALALSSAFMVSLSEGLQDWHERGLGLNDWRDTLLVQISWAFIIYGVGLVLLSFVTRPRARGANARGWLAAMVVVAVFVMAVNALVANDKFAIWKRSDSGGSVVNLISTASLEFDDSNGGQAIRCELISVYTEQNCENCGHSGPRVLEALNRLSRSRYGADFCPVSN